MNCHVAYAVKSELEFSPCSVGEILTPAQSVISLGPFSCTLVVILSLLQL